VQSGSHCTVLVNVVSVVLPVSCLFHWIAAAMNHPLPTQSPKVILEFMLSFHNRRRAASLLPIYLVIVMVPLFAWTQDNPSREQAIRPMHVQKNTERFSNGRPKAEYCFYRGKDALEVLHGKYITWSESGQKLSEQNYRNGKIDGRTVYWHENGKKSWEGTYQEGYAVGTWVSIRRDR
jgi:hypothetical protein